MEFKEGDMVVFNKKYILKLFNNGRNLEYSGIGEAVFHIEKGNKPMEIKDCGYNMAGIIMPEYSTKMCFNVHFNEIVHARRKIRRVK